MSILLEKLKGLDKSVLALLDESDDIVDAIFRLHESVENIIEDVELMEEEEDNE